MYGSYGICRISAIEKRNFFGDEQDYYVLRHIHDVKSTAYVPLNNQETVGKLHPICTKEEVDDLILHMKDAAPAWIANDTVRNEEYNKITKSGDRYAIIMMLKSIYVHRQKLALVRKKLPSTDEKFFKNAETLLFEEFAYALGIDKADVKKYIRSHIGDDHQSGDGQSGDGSRSIRGRFPD